ncbi:histidine kinase [Halovivax asiaticus JCM 14624]|uniref:histidine kinase n=1 Tax=Halovivax asiaticus JCM 14624 TaxID=1227490 RepID=M0BSE6_9EURY|nr:ATP-binding protein [Halovivax asiaticus]ELZ13870.1 histidine kinase [Halovivax asiaticus JCM 14624]
MIHLDWATLGAVVLGAGVLVASRTAQRHERPGVIPFALLVILLAGLSAVIALGRSGLVLIQLGAGKDLLLIGGYGFASLLWVGFVFEYTGRGPVLTPRRWGGIVFLGGLLVASTTVTWGQQTGRFEFALLGQLSYLTTFVLQVAVFSFGLLGVVLIGRSTITYDDLARGSAASLVVAGIGITLLPLSIRYGRQLPGTSMYSVVLWQLLAVAGALAWTAIGTDAFERGAGAGHLARETALDAMSVPVVVVDRADRLLDVNRAAVETFSVDRTQLRDESLTDVIDVPEEPPGGQAISLRTTAGRREFIVEQSEITDTDGETLGRAYRFRDVTERETSEQRIQVLNRVVRHNLRNDLDAIRGFAEPIRNDAFPADEATQYYGRIETIATGLVDLANAVARSERILTEPRLERERCDLVEIAERAVDRSSDADITLEASADVEIRSDPDAVRIVLAELIDNAVTHASQEPQSVTIRVDPTTAGGRIEVRDDGPGIPSEERAVLVDGEETPIKHGSGIGLWLVYWTVTRLGGELSFEEREPHGSIVVVDFPDFGSASTHGSTDA